MSSRSESQVKEERPVSRQSSSKEQIDDRPRRFAEIHLNFFYFEIFLVKRIVQRNRRRSRGLSIQFIVRRH